MRVTKDEVTNIFYLADEFCQEFSVAFNSYQIGNKAKKCARMSDSEVITVLVLFHLGGFRNMKHFYLYYVQKHLQADFPNTVSYYTVCGANPKGLFTYDLVPKDLLPGRLYRNFLCRFNSTKSL